MIYFQGFQQNQIRAEHIGDSSVLPDLCASHQRQLTILRKNHYKIRYNNINATPVIRPVGPWSNGYQCRMRILRPGFNSQRVPDHGC